MKNCWFDEYLEDWDEYGYDSLEEEYLNMINRYDIDIRNLWKEESKCRSYDYSDEYEEFYTLEDMYGDFYEDEFDDYC